MTQNQKYLFHIYMGVSGFVDGKATNHTGNLYLLGELII